MGLLREFHSDMVRTEKRLRSFGPRAAATPAGPVEYAASGDGPPVLVSHGIAGGFDQGVGLARDLAGEGFRVIGVSRFGYLGTPLPKDPAPTAQADAFAGLLDDLGVERAAVVGISAGLPASLEFARRHPGRCASLVVWSGAGPGFQSPRGWKAAAGRLLLNDFIFWLLFVRFGERTLRVMNWGLNGPVTEDQMRWAAGVFRTFLPMGRKRAGIINDIRVTLPWRGCLEGLASIKAPALVLHAEDDRFAPFEGAVELARGLPRAELVGYASGGHLLLGHHREASDKIRGFLKENTG